MAGYRPVASPFVKRRPDRDLVYLKIQVGDRFIKFDPLHCDELIEQIKIIKPGLLAMRSSLSEEIGYDDDD